MTLERKDGKTTICDLPNFGYVIRRIGDKKFLELQKIVNDCLMQNAIDPKVTGLTDVGVAKQFKIPQVTSIIGPIVDELIETYGKHYDYIESYKHLNEKGKKLTLATPWLNVQSKNEYIPNHTHDGIFSYVVWVSVPILPDELEKRPYTGNFDITYPTVIGGLKSHKILVQKDNEGGIILFPAMLQHCVYPFFEGDGKRLSISGNVILQNA